MFIVDDLLFLFFVHELFNILLFTSSIKVPQLIKVPRIVVQGGFDHFFIINALPYDLGDNGNFVMQKVCPMGIFSHTLFFDINFYI